MPSINFTENSIEFDFDIDNNQNFWYSKSNYKDLIIEISADKEIFANEKTIEKLRAFSSIISLNIEKIIQKTHLWTQNLYNELGSFEEEKGYFDNTISIRLSNIENDIFFEFDVNICFFSKIDLLMDINHLYYVQFKTIYDDIFVQGINRE